ncbi:NADH-quinone oxidoreductase subunit J [Fibrobacter sp. UBA4309]|uniref:NADH-quinone oxidoreductase subunit J family protein n=1 Tax=Fibrobacter sp. UBA4309 TaxID=1946537 RepID=UPI0025B82B99|nr:NADH-quinone oxidoreductase subunit J [Fibrobacter sp. UBA4309]
MFPNLTIPDFPLSFPMGGIDIAFYAVAIVMLVTAVFTVAVKNILQSAVALIFSFVATAILYLLLHAEFIALAQVMVYVGGVVIFVVFTILLTSHLGEDAFSTKIPRLFAAFALSIAFVFVMIKCILPVESLSSGVVSAPEGYSGLEQFSLRLLGYGPDGFIIPFEVVSVLLLMTLICAITIARKTKDEVEKEKAVK